MGAGASVNVSSSQDQDSSDIPKSPKEAARPFPRKSSSSGGSSFVTSSKRAAEASSDSSAMKMSCETCSTNFTLFKRKKYCQECHRYFCSSCLPKPPPSSSTGRQCSTCRLLVSGRFSRKDLQDWKIKDMRCFLNARNISTQGCREKHDLIDLTLANFCTQSRISIQEQANHENLVRQMAANVRDISSRPAEPPPYPGEPSMPEPQPNVPSSPPTSTTSVPGSPPHPSGRQDDHTTSQASGDSASRQQEGVVLNTDQLRELVDIMERMTSEEKEPDNETPGQPIRRAHLDDITCEGDIENLSVRQLKELLVNNFVDYKGCCEKAELSARVHRLWCDYLKNKKKAELIHMEDEAEFPVTSENPLEPQLSENVEAQPSESTASKAAVTSEDQNTTSEPGISSSDKEIPGASPMRSKLQSESSSSDPALTRSDDLCHICMDSLVDCILLECGHMVTCTQCGKRLADCPICRQYVVRVVRVFRS